MTDKISLQVIETRQMDHLRVFHDVARALTSNLSLEEVLLTIMLKMAEFFGPERWSLLMVDEEANELYCRMAVGEHAESLKGQRFLMTAGVAGWVAQTGNPLVVPDVSLDPHWSSFATRHPELRIHSMACVPVRSGNKTLAVLQLLNTKLDLLSEYSLSFLRILCDYAAIAIQNGHSSELIPQLSITGGKPQQPIGEQSLDYEEMIRRAIEVIGNEADALRWLGTPVRVLGYQTPISMAHNTAGKMAVFNALGRLEHGVL
jgi:transcriptional regulator with GAF, ATPase, and Fis domain